MENQAIQIIDIIQSIGFTGLLIILVVPKLKRKVFGNGNGNGTTQIKNDIIKTIEENHFHSVNEKLDGLNDTLKDIRDNTRDTLNILKK